MTWAPLETQKEIYEALSTDQALLTLLGAPMRPEKQRLTFNAIPDSGDFKLTYNAEETSSITVSPDMSTDIASALNALTNLAGVTVAKISNLIYEITFSGIANEPMISVSENNVLSIVPAPVGVTVTEYVKGGTSVRQTIFDLVPDDTPYPYIVIYPLPFTERGNHTKEGWGNEFQVSVFYQPGKNGNTGRGYKQVQLIQFRIDELLHLSDLCIEGWNNLGLRRTFVDIQTLEDNVTLNGIQRFNLLLGEA